MIANPTPEGTTCDCPGASIISDGPSVDCPVHGGPQPVRPPRRVQMSRQHPWRAEHPAAVIVARPSRWGNPYRIGQPYMWLTVAEEGALDWPIPTYRSPG